MTFVEAQCSKLHQKVHQFGADGAVLLNHLANLGGVVNGKVGRVDGALNLKADPQTELLALQAHRLHLRVVLRRHFRPHRDHRGAKIFEHLLDLGLGSLVEDDGAASVGSVVFVLLSGRLEEPVYLGQLDDGVDEVLGDAVHRQCQRIGELVIRSLRDARGDAENLQLDGLQLTGLAVDAHQIKLQLKALVEGVLLVVADPGYRLLQVVLEGADVGGQFSGLGEDRLQLGFVAAGSGGNFKLTCQLVDGVGEVENGL